MLGSPIAHSLSPALHRAAYAELGLVGWTYDHFQVTEGELGSFVDALDDRWRGLSLTMPLKVAALQLGEVDRLVELVGAANTLLFTETGRRLYNTDVAGLVTAVRQAGVGTVERVTILGAGATARSSLVSAEQLGASQVVVLARTPAKAKDLRSLADVLELDLTVVGWDSEIAAADLVISTVTAGAADSRAAEIAASAPVIFDAVYDPWPTALAGAAARAGRTVVNGLDLLVGQAVGQIELMTGRHVDAELLLAVGRAALGSPGPASARPPVSAPDTPGAGVKD